MNREILDVLNDRLEYRRGRVDELRQELALAEARLNETECCIDIIAENIAKQEETE